MASTNRNCRVSRVCGHLAAGLFISMVLAWPVPLLGLRYGFITHRYNTAHPWTTPSGIPCGVRISQLPLSDWYQVRPIQSRDSNLPLGDKARVPAWVAAPHEPDPALALIDTGAEGWPYRSFASESWQFSTPRRGANAGSFEELRWARTLATTPRGRIILPLRPIWSGLIADTLLFAAVTWTVWAAGRSGRSALRRRRGHCPRCNYNLSGLPEGSPCPECGPDKP